VTPDKLFHGILLGLSIQEMERRVKMTGDQTAQTAQEKAQAVAADPSIPVPKRPRGQVTTTDNRAVIDRLDGDALAHAVRKASKIGRYDLGDNTELDMIPLVATAVAIASYIDFLGERDS
jgi:hypothetical protein